MAWEPPDGEPEPPDGEPEPAAASKTPEPAAALCRPAAALSLVPAAPASATPHWEAGAWAAGTVTPLEYREGDLFVGTMTSITSSCPPALSRRGGPCSSSSEPRDVFVGATSYACLMEPKTVWRKARMYQLGRDCWMGVDSRRRWFVLEKLLLVPGAPRAGSSAAAAGGGGPPPSESAWALLTPQVLDALVPHLPFTEWWADSEVEARHVSVRDGVDLLRIDARRKTLWSWSLEGEVSIGLSKLPKAIEMQGASSAVCGCKFVHRYWACRRRSLLAHLKALGALDARTRAAAPDGAPDADPRPRSFIDAVFGDDGLARLIVGFAVRREVWADARERDRL